jgi:hypothetical protein
MLRDIVPSDATRRWRNRRSARKPARVVESQSHTPIGLAQNFTILGPRASF